MNAIKSAKVPIAAEVVRGGGRAGRDGDGEMAFVTKDTGEHPIRLGAHRELT